MSTKIENFRILKHSTPLAGTILNTQEILDAIIDTNNYIVQLTKLFKEKHFDLFEVLGQRNLSGLIGEIFSRFFCQKFDDFINNPHPDGRPDILYLDNADVKKYFYEQCFETINGKQRPIKKMLSPFPHNGIEVKCTIGNPVRNYKKLLEAQDKRGFEIGDSRINYLSDLVWWAHHTHSRSLLGLYYDYYYEEGNVPQIMAVFYSNLDEKDWSEVSLGKPTSKKTSNSSLTKEGRSKMKQNCLIAIKDEIYTNKFKDIGISL